MTTYGYDFYGHPNKYGSSVFIDFGVDPFTAEAISHDHISVSWNEPTGDWTKFRLLVSHTGYSINADDGYILLDIEGGKTPQKYVDDVRSNGWYYYTIFLLNDDLITWERAGIASAISIVDFNNKDRLWSLTPDYFKRLKDTTAGYNPSLYAINPAIYLSQNQVVDNLHLKRFYDILGWGFDIVQSEADSILWGYDAGRINYDRLGLLSSQFGAELERSVPAQTSRNLVRNLGLLYRKRGTPDGIEEMLGLATGWNVDVYMGPNLMLSEDQANFINPVVYPWDPTIRYIVDDRVTFNSRNFTAVAIAYGPTQAPPSTGDNTWWEENAVVEENVDLVRSDTDNIGDWEAFDFATGDPLLTVTSTHIGRGVTHPLDLDILSVNALGVKNTTGGTKDILIRTTPWNSTDTDFDRELTLSSVVPVPSAVEDYVIGAMYDFGDMVNFAGRSYQALRTTNRYPMSSDWKVLGYDRRVRLCLSFYTHGRFVGGATSNLVTPYLIAFNDVGDVLYEVLLNPAQITNVNYDSFNQPAPMIVGREFDLGGKSWTGIRQSWDVNWEFDSTGFVSPTTNAQTFALTTSNLADCVIGVTYRSVHPTGRGIGITFRVSDTVIGNNPLLNGWVADQVGVFKTVAGVPSAALFTYPSFVAGDRMTVHLSGSSIIVKKNGTTVGSGTDAFNSTATKHGIMAL